MQHPYQCIATVHPKADTSPNGGYLVAACGPRLTMVDVVEGTVVSQWSPESSASNEVNGADEGEVERPAKKQKKAPAVTPSTNIIKLAVSLDQHHLVAVTDDKCIRVFNLQDGTLVESSQRIMPKRPCAIQLLPDNATIICGDKFGDVYSLPLLPKTASAPEPGPEEAKPAETEANKPNFKPSASNLTVHTKRNRKALEAQMEQKNFSAKKEPLNFEHKLLLGHVSMLTDVTYAIREVDGKQRGHIITADRDEHIRVSRGPPQAHIIEGYCLGHKEFVSKLCLIPGTDLLVSGGGDDWLGVWEWPKFELHRKVSLHDTPINMRISSNAEVYDTAGDTPEANWGMKDPAVSGVWTAPFTSSKGKEERVLIIACERFAGLYLVPVSRLHLKTGSSFGLTLMRLEHPPLDVACVGDSVVLSFDARDDGEKPLQAYRFGQEEGEKKAWRVKAARDEQLEMNLQCLTEHDDAVSKVDGKALDELLYGTANLRKRRGWDTPGEGGEEATPGAEALAAEDAP